MDYRKSRQVLVFTTVDSPPQEDKLIIVPQRKLTCRLYASTWEPGAMYGGPQGPTLSSGTQQTRTHETRSKHILMESGSTVPDLPCLVESVIAQRGCSSCCEGEALLSVLDRRHGLRHVAEWRKW
jgi:hypothetical protein